MAEETRNYRINQEIIADEVRIVSENVPLGIYPIQKALQMAEEFDLDLVEISDKATPPICKIMDYNKFIYELKKKAKEVKSNAIKQVIKEIRFGPNTDSNDIAFKSKHATEFLEEGFKIKAYVHFRGRTIIHTERGAEVIRKFLENIDDYGKIDAEPKMEGKRMIVHISPKPHKKK